MSFNLNKFKNKLETSKAMKSANIIDLSEVQEIKQYISTQVIGIDHALGKGIPVGQITEITGDFSSGKSLICTHLLAETVNTGGYAMLLENEASMDLTFCKNIGLDYSKITHIFPKTLQEGYEIIFNTVNNLRKARLKGEAPPFTLIVWDSMTAAPAFEMKKNDSGDIDIKVSMADKLAQSQVNSALVPQLIQDLKEENIAFVVISQLRDKPGVIYGETEDTTGGRAMKFYAAIRAKFLKGKKVLNSKKEVSGLLGKFYVFKNKCASPFRRADLEIIFDKGFDATAGIQDLVIDKGIIRREGNSYYYSGKSTLCELDIKVATSKDTLGEAIQSNAFNLRAAIVEELIRKF